MESKLSAWLNTELIERGWSERELSRRANVSHGAINNALSGESQTRLDTYRGIAKAFGMSLEEVFRQAGVLPPHPPPVAEEEECLRLIRRLGPDKREAALLMLRGLDENTTANSSRLVQGARFHDRREYAVPLSERPEQVAQLNRIVDESTPADLERLLARLLSVVLDEREKTSAGDRI